MSEKLTGNQELVYRCLEVAQSPLTAYAILDLLRDKGLKAPLQVYRALGKLQTLGLVHRLESLNAFVTCSHPHPHGPETLAFAICDDCDQVTEFSSNEILSGLSAWGNSQNFSPRKTTIEISGLCEACTQKPS